MSAGGTVFCRTTGRTRGRRCRLGPNRERREDEQRFAERQNQSHRQRRLQLHVRAERYHAAGLKI
jgi:hypothetical protein